MSRIILVKLELSTDHHNEVLIDYLLNEDLGIYDQFVEYLTMMRVA